MPTKKTPSLPLFSFLPKIKLIDLIILIFYFVSLYVTYWCISQLPPEIPFNYSLAQKSNQLVMRNHVWEYFIIITSLYLLNYFVSKSIHKRYQLLSKILIAINFLVITLFLITLVKITFLIT